MGEAVLRERSGQFVRRRLIIAGSGMCGCHGGSRRRSEGCI